MRVGGCRAVRVFHHVGRGVVRDSCQAHVRQPPARMPTPVEGQVQRNAPEPGCEGALVPELPQMSSGRDEDILSDILRIPDASGPQHGGHQPEHPLMCRSTSAEKAASSPQVT